MATWSLTRIAERMGNSDAGAHYDQLARAEFARRNAESNKQTVEAQERAAAAAELAARAAQDAAEYTKRNARYMLWSVIVLAAFSVAGLAVAILK